MTTLLALETAGETCSVAVLHEGDVLEHFESAPRRQTELVLPMVNTLLAEAGLSLAQLDGIAFGHGPGAFTGVRVAAAVAQGLAFSHDLPVAGVSTLAACALGIAPQERPDSDGAIVAFDARMGELYLAAYRYTPAGVQTVLNDGLYRPDALPKIVGDQWLLAGSGLIYRDALLGRYSVNAEQPEAHPRAAAVAQLGSEIIAQGKGVPAEQAQPVYLRDQVIQGAVR